MSDPLVIIYTDGAASPNPGRGGYGAVILREGTRRELSGGFRHTTNNRMELLSVIVALQQLPEPRATVTVFSDSKYVVDNLNGGYAARWRRNHWRTTATKQPAKNADLWQTLLELAERHQVTFTWVKSHADNPENNRCDELAVLARQARDLPGDAGFEELRSAPLPPALPSPPAPLTSPHPPPPAPLPPPPQQMELFGFMS
jgi:ribonuclease HI